MRRAPHAVVRNHLVDPGKAIEMVAVEFARFRRAQRRQRAGRVAAKDRAVGHVGKAGDRERSRAHALARSPFGGAFDVIPVVPPWVWTSTEIDLRSTSSAAAAVSAVCAAAVEPTGPTSPANIAPTEANGIPGAKECGTKSLACPQQSIAASFECFVVQPPLGGVVPVGAGGRGN